jgi:hypothetical protein
VPIAKPAQKHIYNAKTVHTHNKNNMAAVGKSNIMEVVGQKP